ncbi:MAG: hypothetical protein U0166_13785 [Acidobacteriota bacterium]
MRRCSVFVALALTACGRQAPAPDAGLPPGALLSADGGGCRKLLDALRGMEGTAIAASAAEAEQRIAGCAEVEARSTGELGALLLSLSCATPSADLAALRAIRGPHAIAFALPIEDGERLVGTVDVASDGTVSAIAVLPAAPANDPLRMVLPAEAPPGPPNLASAGALLHARLRSDGGLAAVARSATENGARDGQSLLKLRGDLLLGAVFTGVWEASLYVPDEGYEVPHPVVAFDFTNRRAAVAAMEAFVADVLARWPVHRTDLAIGEARGACVGNLSVMPELAPCYVATDRAVLIGWNQRSLERALAPGGTTDLGPSGGAVVHVDRFAEADARIASTRGAAPAPPLPSPWDRLEIVADHDAGGYRFRATLLPRGAP